MGVIFLYTYGAIVIRRMDIYVDVNFGNRRVGASKRFVFGVRVHERRRDTYLLGCMDGPDAVLGGCIFVFLATDWTDGLAIRIDILISVFLLLF
jgi:hypothetical protein